MGTEASLQSHQTKPEEEKVDPKFKPDATDGVVWCARCDSEMIFVHSSMYCPNCKMKMGCCG